MADLRQVQRVSPVPSTSSLDPGLRRWLGDVADALNAIPNFSTFSIAGAAGPESAVTAPSGTLGVNLASSASVGWLKITGDGNTGWSFISSI